MVYDTLAEVKTFTDEVAKTGEWNGELLEGFVVRTRIVDPKPGSTSRDKQPPYPTGSSFFFKVKFDEPYMMYRDWREITKSLLFTKGSFDDAKLPKSKMKRKETQVYLKWVKNEIQTNRSAFEGYAQGKGILATREWFLKWLGTEQGKADLSDVEKKDHVVGEFGKTVIVPVAVPGCGELIAVLSMVVALMPLKLRQDLCLYCARPSLSLRTYPKRRRAGQETDQGLYQECNQSPQTIRYCHR